MKQRRLLDQVGLRLSRQALRLPRELGMPSRSAVSLEHQHLAKRYVKRGLESGGAVGDPSRYVTFAQPDGRPVEYLHPVDAFGVTGLHAVVVSPSLVRMEMLRKRRTYELLITQHQPSDAIDRKRPALLTKVLFRRCSRSVGTGSVGHGKAAGRPGTAAVLLGGEEVAIPKRFREAIQAVTKGGELIGCSHCHFAGAPKKRDEGCKGVVPATTQVNEKDTSPAALA